MTEEEKKFLTTSGSGSGSSSSSSKTYGTYKYKRIEESDNVKRPVRVHISKRHLVIVSIITVLCVAAICVGLGLGIPAIQKHYFSSGTTPTYLVPPNPTENPPPFLSKLGKFRKAALNTDGEPCAAIGRSVLEKGGNAIDATIAVLFCVGVNDPQSMGLGGGFLMTIYHRKSQTAFVLNARETAPANSFSDMFHGNSTLSLNGPLAIAVPGELKGYWEAHQRFGKLSWSDLIQPSIQLCKEGVNVSWHLVKALKQYEDVIKADSSMSEVFLNPDTQKLWVEGDKIKRPKLAETLKILAEKGGDELYTGELAKKLVMDMQKFGGIITEEDLANYRAKWEEPVTVRLKDGVRMYSVPPPGSGAVLGFILNILDGYNFTAESIAREDDAILTYHRIIEAFKYAYGKRTELGDPDDPAFRDHINELVANMTSEKYAEDIRQRINSHFTRNDPSLYGAQVYQGEDHGTAHCTVLAPNGDAVTVTSTVNGYFGAKLRSIQTGIILNNEMDDFSSPNIINMYGIPPSPANFIKPGKRPLSSISPAIFVHDNGDVKLVTGSIGGSKITTSVAYVAIRNMWFDEDIKKATDSRRIHHQLLPMIMEYEYGFLDQYVKGLEALGHITSRHDVGGSAVRGIAKEEDGFIYASYDIRKPGSVDGF